MILLSRKWLSVAIWNCEYCIFNYLLEIMRFYALGMEFGGSIFVLSVTLCLWLRGKSTYTLAITFER